MDEQEVGTDSSQEDTENEPAQTPGEQNDIEAPQGDRPRDPMVGQAGDAFAWLEGPAFDAPIEEMPTLQWPDVAAEARQADSETPAAAQDQARGTGPVADGEPGSEADDLADAMQWLEGLATEQGTPLDEMPTLISTGRRDTDWETAAQDDQDLADLGDTTPPPQLDSDPMAWLEQLAIEQNSPLEDLPSVADRLLASEIVSQTALEDGQDLEPLTTQLLELEAALKYLEDQAAAQGIVLDDVSIDDLETDAAVDQDLSTLDKLVIAGAVAESLTGDESAAAGQLLEDSDADLSWLAELSADESPTLPPAPGEPDLADAGEPAAEDEQAPEEIEDSTRKGLAAVGAAQLAHSILEDEQEQPPAAAGPDVTADEDILAAMPDDPDEALAWMGKMSDEEPTAEPVDSEAGEPGSAPHGQPEDRQDSSLLRKATTAAGAAHLAKSLLDTDSDDQTQAAAAESGVIDQDILQGMPDDPDEAMAWMAGLAAPEDVSRTPERAAPPPAAAPAPQQDPFTGARTALAAGNLAGAVKQYRAQLDEGAAGPELVAELEEAAAAQPGEPELLQLLGDAYMQNGQQQKALKAYSQVFDQS